MYSLIFENSFKYRIEYVLLKTSKKSIYKKMFSWNIFYFVGKEHMKKKGVLIMSDKKCPKCKSRYRYVSINPENKECKCIECGAKYELKDCRAN